MILQVLGIILLGYLIGAVPFGVIVGKIAKGIDIRQYGSGNIGFANVLRVAGVKAGVITLVLDIGKGALAAFLGGIIIGSQTATFSSLTFDTDGAEVIAALAAVIGHNWSVYLRFEGGRGVDTSVGGLIAMSPPVGFATLLVGLVVIFSSRYVSVGSMSGAASSIVILAPLVATGHQPAEFLIYGILGTGLIIFRHRENIRRVCSGTEPKLGQKGEER